MSQVCRRDRNYEPVGSSVCGSEDRVGFFDAHRRPDRREVVGGSHACELVRGRKDRLCGHDVRRGCYPKLSDQVPEAGVVVHEQDARFTAINDTGGVRHTARGIDTQYPALTTSMSSPQRTAILPSMIYPVSSREWCTCSGGEEPTGKVISSTTVSMPGAQRCSTTSKSRNHHAWVCSFWGLSMTAVLMERPPSVIFDKNFFLMGRV
jgi:hypothetical protein